MGNLYLFTGEETFLLHQQVKAWKEAFRKRCGDDMNLLTLDGEQLEESEIISQVETLPFLADKRLIFIEGLPEVAKASAKGKSETEDEADRKPAFEKLMAFLDKIPETSVVVFVQPKPDKRKSLYKKIVQKAEVKEFRPLKDAALVQWIRQQAMAHKGAIAGPAATHLAEQVGSDLWRLDLEIQKLCAYASGKPIRAEMVDALVTPSLEANIFHLTDALGAKDGRTAMRNLHRSMAAGESLTMVFYMIVRQFRLILQVAGYVTSNPGANSVTLASALKLHPFVAKNILGQVHHFRMPELKSAYRKLLEIDLGLKTSKIQMTADNQDELALAIEKFILEFCK